MKSNKPLYLPAKLYEKVMATLCIACVDIVVKTPKGVLLGVRDYEPVKGRTWLIGGRLLFGERPDLAVVRKVREETGLKVKVERFVGTYSLLFTKGQRRYNVAMVFLVSQTGGKLKLTKEYSKYIFIKKMQNNLHPYVKKALVDSRVFSKEKMGKNVKRLPFFLN